MIIDLIRAYISGKKRKLQEYNEYMLLVAIRADIAAYQAEYIAYQAELEPDKRVCLSLYREADKLQALSDGCKLTLKTYTFKRYKARLRHEKQELH